MSYSRSRRIWAKAATIGATAGVLASGVVVTLANTADASTRALIEALFTWPLAIGEFFAEWAVGGLDLETFHHERVSLLLSALVAGISVAGQACLLIGTGKGPLVDWLWPEPPDVLDIRLFRPDVDPEDPRLPGRPLRGRDEELRALLRFAGKEAGSGGRWTVLWGPHGVGKTRLALEWLARLQAQGWDVGTLRPGTTELDIRRARFRCDTAILVDEAARLTDQGLWAQLALLLQRRCRLRVLLVDQTPLTRSDALDSTSRRRLDEARWTEIGADGLQLAGVAPRGPA